MLKNGIKISICIGIIFSIFMMGCSSIKGAKSGNDSETAAKLMMDHPGLSDFESIARTIDPSRYIVIDLRSGSMSGRENMTEIVYDQSMKKWTGGYKSQNNTARADPNGIKERRNDLSPKSGWLPLVKMLIKNNVHTIRDSRSIEYKQLVADGVSYTLTIQIGDKQRKYSFSNPSIYAKHYPDIKDFADFDRIVDILRAEFRADK